MKYFLKEWCQELPENKQTKDVWQVIYFLWVGRFWNILIPLLRFLMAWLGSYCFGYFFFPEFWRHVSSVFLFPVIPFILFLLCFISVIFFPKTFKRCLRFVCVCVLKFYYESPWCGSVFFQWVLDTRSSLKRQIESGKIWDSKINEKTTENFHSRADGESVN